MANIFRIKIKIALLILIWALMWRHDTKVKGAELTAQHGVGVDAAIVALPNTTKAAFERSMPLDAEESTAITTTTPIVEVDAAEMDADATTVYPSEDEETDAEEEDGAAEEEGEEEEDIDMTAILQQQLIYDFAIKYKQIPRVTYLTCRTQAADTSSNSNGNNNNNNNNNDNDNRNDKSNNENDEEHNKQNMYTTMAILQRMFSSTPNMPITSTAGKASSGNSTTKQPPTPVSVVVEKKPAQQQKLSKGILIKVVQIDQLINKRKSNNNNNNKNNMQRSNGGGFPGFGAYGRGGAGTGGGAAGRNAYTNANWLEHILRSDVRRQIVVLNLSCGAASRRLLEMASNKALFNSSYHWLLMEDYAFNRQTGIDDNDKNNVEVVNNEQTKNHNVATTVASAPATAASMSERQRQPGLAGNTGTGGAGTAGTGATADATGNEDDMEIIEKFLEKINININTELILAKRMRGRNADAPLDVTAMLSGNNGANNNSNNSLQKKDYYMLYDVWSPGLQYGGQLNISEIGYFTLDDGLQIAHWYRRSTTITRRMNMHMARIRCLVVITHKNRTDTLEHYLTTHYDTHLDSMNRFNFALLSNVRDLFNFSFVLSKTATWGYLKNGKFDGMIGALVRKQADIGGSPIFFRIERAKVIDYTSRTWVARPCFIFRHPRSTKKDRIVFLQPFSNDVWIFLGLCGIITILLLWLLTTLERKLDAMGYAGRGVKGASSTSTIGSVARAALKLRYNNNNSVHAAIRATDAEPDYGGVDDDDVDAPTSTRERNAAKQRYPSGNAGGGGGNAAGCKLFFVRCGLSICGRDSDNAAENRLGLFLESLLFYIGSICQQGLSFSTRFFSGRCIVITSLLFAFSIYQFYSASIVGTLLMEKPKTIRTLRDLIHSSLEIGIEDIVYNRDFFLRTKDPDAIELYAKKVTSVPMTGDTFAETPGDSAPPVAALPALPPDRELTEKEKAKSYRDILHSHETGAHAKTNEASNWYDPDYGVGKIKKGRFAFHVDVATAYKIIADTFNEKEICDLTEIQLFPPQKMVSIVQKGSPLRKIITYGLRRVTEVGLMDYQRRIWHSPKPPCVKQLHTDDLRVDMQTFASALFVLLFGYGVSLLALGVEIMHHKLKLRYPHV